ncbi:MAG: hypothetical protein DRH50_05190 [Deltaproteobacteria bacterium]|nr:MAG: hypothetical protein DRH50_05190 [Deltaproteobacteria bacterium]
MFRNVALVRLKNLGVSWVAPPLGIGYLLKALKKVAGVRPLFIDCQLENLDNARLIERLRPLEPMIVGIQVYSVEYASFQTLLPVLRKAFPGTVLVAGGPHVSGLPDHTLLSNPDLDFAVKGEGEEALPQLARSLLSGTLDAKLPWIPNLVYLKNGKCVHNEIRWGDVNAYGAPAWEELRPDRYPPVQHGTFHKSTRVAPILTSRGCPFPCTFCAGHINTGKRVRLRDAGNVVDEIESLQYRYGIEEFIIEDENFTFDRNHVVTFVDELERRGLKCHFSLASGVRLDGLDEDLVRCLRRMGTYTVTLGIESGSVRTLRRMKKNWDLQMVLDKIRLLKRHGIMVLGCFILGFRDETMEDIRKTVAFALDCGIDMAYFGNYLPLPGSVDFKVLLQRGELNLRDMDWSNYYSYLGKAPYHPREVKAAQLQRVVKQATIRFYLRPRILFTLLKRMTHPIFVKSLLFRASKLFALGKVQTGG